MSDKINEEKQKGPLHIVITPSGAGKLDQSYGHFQLEKGGDFSVTIREFADKKEKIDKEELEARKFIDGKLLSNTAYQQLDKKQRDTYDANVAVYNQNTKLRTKRGSSLVSSFSEVAWVWQLADKTYSAAKNEGEEWDLTADLLEKLEKTLKPLNDIADLLTSILDGKKNGNTGDQPTAEHRAALESVKNDPKNKALTDLQDDFDKNIQKQRAAAPDSPEHKQAVREAGLLQRKMDSRSKSLGLKLTRAPVGMEIYYPEFALEFDWSRVPVKNPGYEHLFNKTAVFLDGVIEAKPLIGIKMFLDFLALAQRAHPIALALIAAADIAMSLIGDGSKITLEISATAIVGGKLQGFFNTLTGENTFNNKDRDANSKALADISGDITVKVSASVKMAICKRAFFIVVKGDLDVGVEAEAKFTVKTTLDFDDTGIFFNPEASFDGIQLKGKANIKLDAGKEDGPAFVKVDSKNEFIYQAIDRQKPAKIGKVYFKKFE